MDWQTGPPVLVAALGGDPRCLARITTPFILERANHPKGWDAKRQTAGGQLPWWLRCRRDEHEANSPSVPRSTATGISHEVVKIRGQKQFRYAVDRSAIFHFAAHSGARHHSIC